MIDKWLLTLSTFVFFDCFWRVVNSSLRAPKPISKNGRIPRAWWPFWSKLAILPSPQLESFWSRFGAIWEPFGSHPSGSNGQKARVFSIMLALHSAGFFLNSRIPRDILQIWILRLQKWANSSRHPSKLDLKVHSTLQKWANSSRHPSKFDLEMHSRLQKWANSSRHPSKLDLKVRSRLQKWANS